MGKNQLHDSSGRFVFDETPIIEAVESGRGVFFLEDDGQGGPRVSADESRGHVRICGRLGAEFPGPTRQSGNRVKSNRIDGEAKAQPTARETPLRLFSTLPH